LEADKIILEFGREDTEKSFSTKNQDFQTDIIRLEIKKIKTAVKFNDLKKKKQNLRGEITELETKKMKMTAKLNDLKKERQIFQSKMIEEFKERLKIEKKYKIIQNNLDIANNEK
jgi:hypothetical protein